MDQQYGQQHSSKGSQPTPQPGPWDGDQMLHIYLRDYLHKRGYSQAAQALSGEAGLEPSRQVPIDAPQSLLFEWWVVFWDIFASRADEAGVDVNGGLAEDARVYVLDLDVSRTLGLIRPASLVVIQQCMDMMGFGGKRVDQLDAKQQQALAKRLNRLQTAHTDAQVKLAQLHGIQPPKALLVNSSARTQPRPTAVDGYANGAAQSGIERAHAL
uniref:Uncharacterized protein n=1 Tax=Kalmanozyma brasiliensis (strain GHG001) TaxID=1365824 RepID=V5GMJ8_KALBG